MPKRRWQTDGKLWALAAWAAFVPLVFWDVRGDDGKGAWSLWEYVRLLWEGGYGNGELFTALLMQSVILAVPAVIIGWVVQALIVIIRRGSLSGEYPRLNT